MQCVDDIDAVEMERYEIDTSAGAWTGSLHNAAADLVLSVMVQQHHGNLLLSPGDGALHTHLCCNPNNHKLTWAGGEGLPAQWELQTLGVSNMVTLSNAASQRGHGPKIVLGAADGCLAAVSIREA